MIDERRTLTSFPQHENGLIAIVKFAIGDDDIIRRHIDEDYTISAIVEKKV